MVMAAKKKLWKVQVVDACINPEEKSFWWRLRAPNGEIAAGAETYTTKAKARKTAKRVYELMDPERVVYEEVEE